MLEPWPLLLGWCKEISREQRKGLAVERILWAGGEKVVRSRCGSRIFEGHLLRAPVIFSSCHTSFPSLAALSLGSSTNIYSPSMWTKWRWEFFTSCVQSSFDLQGLVPHYLSAVQEPQGMTSTGAVLFADASGFTALTQRLSETVSGACALLKGPHFLRKRFVEVGCRLPHRLNHTF